MRKLITGISIAAAIGACAAPLTPEEALARLAADGPHRAHAASPARTTPPSPVFTVATEQGAAAYVFNCDGGTGYIVVGADDVAPALLGYSDTGRFDAENTPPALKAWLDGYARRIAWASRNLPARSSRAVQRKQRDDVAPKLTTAWNQNAPYWDYCPKQSNKRCYTGCVATAMAQIMNWHEWPEKPSGSITYKPLYLNATLKIDFDTVRFDWDKMLDRYTPQSPAENIRAVASLMQACGYAAKMEYTSSVSGALTHQAAAGMIEHFGYDKALAVVKRDWYGTSEWEDIVYDELTANGPVYYDGSGEGGGHAFVCDGYRASDGFFHFNWGWGGLSDGYFRLDALYPEEQGAGGVAVGYTWDQAIMRGIKRAEAGSEKTAIMGTYAGVRCPLASQTLGKHMTLTGYETSDGFANYSIFTLENLFLALEVTDTSTGEKRYLPRARDNHNADPMEGETMEPYKKILVILAFLPEDLPEGDYTVRPVYRLGNEGEWLRMVGNPAFRQEVCMKVEGNTATFSLAEPEARLDIEIERLPEYFTSGGSYTIDCLVRNTGQRDFSGTICGVFMTEVNGEVKVAAKGRDEYVAVAAGSTARLAYTSDVASGSIDDGDYGFCFGNSLTGEVVSDLYQAFVGNRYGSLELSYFNLEITNRMSLDAGFVEATMDITCPQGTYDGPLALLFSTSKRDFKAEHRVVSEESFQFTAVETKKVWISGTFNDAVLGMTYYCLPGYRSDDGEFVAMGTNPVPVTIGAISGMAPAEHGAERSVTVWGLDGTVVAAPVTGVLSDLPAGVYIVRTTSAGGRVSVDKLIVR